MTEIPEHLLARSRARRAAIEGGDDAGEAAAPKAAAPAKVEAASDAGESTPAAAATPAVVEETTVTTYVAPEVPGKRKIPLFAMPVVIIFPFWVLLYTFAFGSHHKASRPTDPIELGKLIFVEKGCSGCHGAGGVGVEGNGPKLADGESKLTFPDEADHISWVRTGSAPFQGGPYGDPNRPGGQHIASIVMPGFGGSLTQEELEAVVAYERSL